jgi:hypothetical protein
MILHRKLLATAVGAACAAAAGGAFASSISATLSAGNVVTMSGATGQDASILAVMRRQCAAGSLDVYNFSGTNKQEVYSCTDGGAFGLSGTIVTYKDSAVGSANGVVPFIDTPVGIQFATLDTTNFNTTNCVSSSVAAATSGGLLAYTNWACSTLSHLNSAAVPDVGFSDVEPAIFGFSSTPGANVATANQLIEGVMVSEKLYLALQTAQGTTGRPSLSSAQVAGIFSGNIVHDSQLGLATTGVTDHTIYIARRGTDSGTEASAEVNMLQQGIIFPPPSAMLNANNALHPIPGTSLGTGDPTSVTVNTSNANYNRLVQYCGNGTVAPTATGTNKWVFAGAGGGDDANCLNYHGNYRFAIGIQSLQTSEDAAYTDSSNTNYPTTSKATSFVAPGTAGQYWRFVKIDGVAPTAANVIKGSYQHWVEQAVLANVNTAGTGAGTAFQVYNVLLTDLASGSTLATLNASYSTFFDEPAGAQSTGNTALPNPTAANYGYSVPGTCSATFAVAGTTADSDPVNNATKSQSGGPNSATKPPVAVCPPRS